MRYISMEGRSPNAAWLKKAEKLIKETKDAPDDAARHAIIDQNQGFWGGIRDDLLAWSFNKCWFSEAADCAAHWHVEHFRPKKSAKDESGKTVDAGYWWLAFDWRNYRLCGSVPNVSKGTYFPLREGCARAAPFAELAYEDPLLLDPADPEDPGLLSFGPEGNPKVAPGIDDAWRRKRVEYSIRRLKLDSEPLTNRRRTIWNNCQTEIDQAKRELKNYAADPNNMIARDRSKAAIRRLREMIKPDREMSAVARACIAFSDEPTVRNILTSA